MDPDRPAGNGLRIDPVTVARGAALLLAAAERLAGTPAAGQIAGIPADGSGVGADVSALGADVQLPAAVTRAAGAVLAAPGGVGEGLRADADRLYQVATATTDADGRAEARLSRPGGRSSRSGADIWWGP